MKGIVLAGGSGSRLFPLTNVTSKQLLPVYDKPMIYYPLSILMLAGIKDILIISTPQDIPRFRELFGDGNKIGINISYCVQPTPDGLAQAFILGEEFIGNESCAMILGDNIIFGDKLRSKLIKSVYRAEKENKATVFARYVKDPERFGVVEFDENDLAISIEEKPINPKSNYAITGLYFYPRGVSNLAKTIKPSLTRNELEITDLNNLYLKANLLCVERLGRGTCWIDAGTHDSLVEATLFIKTTEENMGLKISCLEEISYLNGWMSRKELESIGLSMKNNEYGQHLLNVASGRIKY